MIDLTKNNELDDFDVDFGTVDEETSFESDLDVDFGTVDEETSFESDLEQFNESDNEITDTQIENNITEEKSEQQIVYEDNNQSDDVNSDSSDERSSKLKNYILYIVSDKTFPGMLGYFRHYGSKVTKIFNNLNDAKDTLLMQIEPCKVVIIDSGTGKFTSMTARKSLMELLSISDEENRIAIFYTDSVIVSEAKNTDGVESKDITWHKYKTTADVLAVLLRNLKKENYVYDIKDDDNIDKSEEVINFIGATVKGTKSMDIGLPVLRLHEIIMHTGDNTSENEELPGYKVKV